MNAKPRILIIDDDSDVVEWLIESLASEGFEPLGETSARNALERLRHEAVDLVISDVEMPEMRGVELLRTIQGLRPSQMVLLMTAFGSIDLAVESVRAGAVDFLAKPFRIEAMCLAIRRSLRERQMRREIVRLREAAAFSGSAGIAARSEGMRAALEIARKAAKSALPVLITGESGVGKGALARFVHQNSPRAKGKCVQLNCAALPAGLAEAELFGVRRGAFTDALEDRPGVFEEANGGTLFLDEVGELPLELQPKLLQALESTKIRPVGSSDYVTADVRILAATNRPLEDALAERSFRPDLYHRLNVVRIEVPPLRDRPEDIDPLVDLVLKSIDERTGAAPLGVSKEAMDWLRTQSWPGNVRELINAVERAAALSDHDVLTIEDFTLHTTSSARSTFLEDSVRGDLSLAELERRYIERILEKTGGHKARAARILGVDRRTLYRKLAEAESRRVAGLAGAERPVEGSPEGV